jgi:3-oxoacyl-[acyl-carrier-protein] synthase II
MTKIRRVVITGMGALTPCGNSVDELYASLCRGESGIRPISGFDTAGFETTIAGEVRNFDPLEVADRRSLRQFDRFTLYALAAAAEAVRDAGLDTDKGLDKQRMGVVIGSSIGGLASTEKAKSMLDTEGPAAVSPFSIPAVLANLAAAEVSIRYGARGYIGCPSTACSAGNMALGESAAQIRQGYADIMLAGGAEAPVTPLAVSAFNALRALSRHNSEPERASRPFDLDRDGFVLGEGAGVLVLEELTHALARGARVYAELAGYACCSDAYHRTTPADDHRGARQCMSLALEDAGLAPGQIDYINAHGTSTLLNDAYETRAIHAVFDGSMPHISSTKSMTGHLIGAAGAVEAIICVKTIRQGMIPPTINLRTPDPDCFLDYTANRARRAAVNTVMSNAFGFGGVNAVIIVKRFEDE